MPGFESILDKREKRIQNALEAFTDGFSKIESNLYKRLVSVLKTTTVNFGKLTNDEYSKKVILGIDNEIRNALQESGYGNKVYNLVSNYDFIAEDNVELQKELNKKNVSEKLINSVKQIEIQNTIDNLLNSGVYKDFIAPVRTALYRHVVLGTSLQDAEETVRRIVVSEKNADSSLLRYANQVAHDALYQYDGSINKAIEEELGLDSYLYVGSIVVDSRAQCKHWVGKQILKKDKALSSEILTAKSGGLLGGIKCSGMNQNTTIDNFSIYRGGYRCRHKAIPTLYSNFK